jgi:transposase
MPKERLSMRKIREVLRLRFEHGRSHRDIARSCGIGITTAREYILRAKAAGLSWPLPVGVDDGALDRMLFPPPPRPGDGERPLPSWPAVHRELRKRGVTLQLLGDEYKSIHPEGYGYSRYCELYRAFAKTLDVTMRFEHRAGERLFVDYAGDTMGVVNPQTGEVMEAHLFVAAQGASNYTYAEATWTEELGDWIASHTRALAYFGGVNAVVVPDNTKCAVTSPHRYEPDLNPTYADWARHNGCAVIPARAYKPRDKGKVEAAVLGVERWLMAPLRNRTFFSLAELNEALRERLEAYNNRPFQKLEGSRKSLFEELDKPALKALPVTPYAFADWSKATVHIDYHVEVDKHRYSVPHQLVHKKVDVRSTQATVEVFCKGKRVASHVRNVKKGGFTTLKEHMPKAHREHAEWTPDRLIRWARKTGERCEELVEKILAGRPHPQQGFRACLGILRLGKRYGPDRLEAACKRALAINSLGYKSVESILKNNLDKRPLPEKKSDSPAIQHDHLRGAQYYEDTNQTKGEAASC